MNRTRLPPSAHWFLNFALPASLAVNVLLTLVFSRTPIDLYVVRGTPADMVFGAYAFLLIACMAARDSVRLHYVAMPLAVLAYLGRAYGFLRIVIEGDGISAHRWDLLAAVSARLCLLVAAVSWHLIQAWRTTIDAEARHHADNR